MLLIPLFAFVSLFVCLRARLPDEDWRLAFVRATLLWALAATALVELLSLGSLVKVAGLTAGWLLVAVAALAFSRVWRASVRRRLVPKRGEPWTRTDWALLAMLAFIALVTAIVARWAPPQTWDSLNYHMARVAHWAQDGSVRPFATGIGIQNSMPPGAEMLVLHVYVLSGGDLLVNFVGWWAILAVQVAVSLLAKELGARRQGQWLAALFAASLPMAIIEASSTTTDSVLSLWVVTIAVEMVRLAHRQSVRPWSYSLVALGAGLAILTKPTAFAYLLPLAGWVAVDLIRRRAWRLALGATLLGVFLVLSVNAGAFSRNLLLYGNPVGPAQRISEHSNQWLGGRGWLSNILRNAAYQMATPSPYVNKAIALSVIEIHRWMGLDVNDPRTTSTGSFKVGSLTTSEDLAQNPLQAVLLLAALVFLTVRPRAVSPMVRDVAVALVLSFLAFSLLFKWQVFGSRYLLPFFALAAPLVGVLLARAVGQRFAWWVGVVLVVAAVPWLFSIEARPLIALDPNGGVKSVLTMPRTDLYFANGAYLEKPYTDMAAAIDAAGCRSVGLMLSGNQAEYPLWALLGAPASDLNIGWIVAGTPSAVYGQPDFSPCAIIGESSHAMPDSLRGIPLVYTYGRFGLYLEPRDRGNSANPTATGGAVEPRFEGMQAWTEPTR